MGRFEMSIDDHNEIRRSAGVQAELSKVADRIAAQANSRAGTTDGYGTDLTVGTDRARAHVWAKTGEALHAEAKTAPLMGIVGGQGRK